MLGSKNRPNSRIYRFVIGLGIGQDFPLPPKGSRTLPNDNGADALESLNGICVCVCEPGICASLINLGKRPMKNGIVIAIFGCSERKYSFGRGLNVGRMYTKANAAATWRASHPKNVPLKKRL